MRATSLKSFLRNLIKLKVALLCFYVNGIDLEGRQILGKTATYNVYFIFPSSPRVGDILAKEMDREIL